MTKDFYVGTWLRAGNFGADFYGLRTDYSDFSWVLVADEGGNF